MDTERLRLLVELERLGSMRAVAEELDTTTSRVSHQLALLSDEFGVALLEPAGRLVRLTAAGHRLVARGRVVLAELEAARSEEAGDAEPAGTVRVVAFATAIRRTVIPAIGRLAVRHPAVRIVVTEHEPDDARALLLADRADLALLYDYDLAPLAADPALEMFALWTARWSLGVPAGLVGPDGRPPRPSSLRASTAWIGNSRNTADERAIAVLTAMSGVTPVVSHRCDDLDAVGDLIAAGEGVGLLPADRPVPRGVRLVPLDDPPLRRRASAAHRAGRGQWPPLRAVLDEVRRAAAPLDVSGPPARPDAD